MSASNFTSANPPMIGQRVQIQPDTRVSYSRTGKVSDLIFKGETYARIILESGGVVPLVSVVVLSPAPTIREQLPQYSEADVRKNLAVIVSEEFRATTLTQGDLALRVGVAGSTIGSWRRKGAPVDRLQQLADILGIRSFDVEDELRHASISPTYQAPVYGSAYAVAQ